MKSRSRRKPRRLEAPVVDAVCQLLKRLGATVYRAQQHGWAASDPGQPDLTVFLPKLSPLAHQRPTSDKLHLWIECKALGEALSPDQRRFQAECEAAGRAYVVAESAGDVLAWLHDYSTGHVTILPSGELALTQAALRAGTSRSSGPPPGDPLAIRPEAPPATLGPQRGA